MHLSQTRKGKGNALACGFEAATGDIVVMIDADGSTNPQEIPRYVDTLIAGADFAKGSRFIRGGGSDDITRFRQAGNRGLNGLVNLLFSTKFTDLCYGYNAFWRDCLDVIRLPDTTAVVPQWGDGFEVETLINVRAAACGLNIVEVSSHEADRVHGTSNLRPISDGIRVLRTISREFVLTRADRKSSRRRTRQRRGSSVGWSARATHRAKPAADHNYRQMPSHSRIRYIEYECDADATEHP